MQALSFVDATTEFKAEIEEGWAVFERQWTVIFGTVFAIKTESVLVELEIIFLVNTLIVINWTWERSLGVQFLARIRRENLVIEQNASANLLIELV